MPFATKVIEYDTYKFCDAACYNKFLNRSAAVYKNFLSLAGRKDEDDHEVQEEEGQLAEGLTSRVFQHELDHLDGILFIDRIGEFARRRAFEKVRKIEKMRKRGKEKYKARFAL